MDRIESLLSARLFVSPQIVEKRLYFLSNLSGHLSLYGMDYGGSVPEPLLPPDIALQNPHLIGGYSFVVFPELEKILVMMDQDGNEVYHPVWIPLSGGFPEPVFADEFSNCRVHLTHYDLQKNQVFFAVEPNDSEIQVSYLANLKTGLLTRLASSKYGAFPLCASPDEKKFVISDGYTTGDVVLYLCEPGKQRELLYGVPLEQRKPGVPVELTGITAGHFTPDGKGLLLVSAVFDDCYGPAYLDLANPSQLQEVTVRGKLHHGEGELVTIESIHEDLSLVEYNIDGCSWLYEGRFDRDHLTLTLNHVLVGDREPLKNGMLASVSYDMKEKRAVVSYSSAVSPTQIYTLEGTRHHKVTVHTREKVLGVAVTRLSPGEDASFVSFDGTRISARLYLPASELGYKGPRPLIYYIHGGPQGQERPDFAWFSMPLIQFLTLNGFAVFVPNVRGSTGYGLSYTRQVDRDWGGRDRLDHVHAMRELAKDDRILVEKAGVVGRSYGGYMTLTMASRHPDLWSAAVDMFGPFDLLTFSERIPESWKPYFRIALGDPQEDHEFLEERSPKTYIDQVTCPMLVIQGKNDPRVVERESHDLVDYMRSTGKIVEYLMFENEGHDVLKYENRVRCYLAITEFFKQYLKP